MALGALHEGERRQSAVDGLALEGVHGGEHVGRGRLGREVLRQLLQGPVGVHLLDFLEAADVRLDGLEVREHAAEPALVHERHPAARRFLHDGILRLPLRSHEEDGAVPFRDAFEENARVVERLERLLQIDDVDPVPLDENELLHLGVPAAGLVPEVDSRFEQLLHADVSQS